MANQHICGTCNKEFAAEQAYLNHVCKTGFKPSQIEHQDALTNGRFSKQAEAALKRGAEKKAKKEKVK